MSPNITDIETERSNEIMKTKKCAKCSKKKSVTQFSKDSKQPDKLNIWCKECGAEYRLKLKTSKKSGSTSKKTKTSSTKKTTKKPKPKKK